MDIFLVLTLIGGLALFLYGMETMGDGLVMLSGGRLERILEKLTSKRILAVLLGAVVTAVIQSSSATTVMVVGFVNSGIMKLGQAVGIIMGANIGTTITSWLLSLTGIEGSSIFIRMLKPSSFSPILAAIGIIMLMTARENSKKKHIGMIMVGFAVLMFGMDTMSGAVAPLADNEKFTNILLAFSNPILGMAAGAVLTAIIQSSSASVGILQALCITGAVSYSTALPIIMGQNIGTCVTAILSSIGASKNARRASMIHLYFNLIGTIIFMAVFYSINRFVDFSFMHEAAGASGIAVVHSLFNIGCTICLFPFANQLVKLATVTIPDKKEGEALLPKQAWAALDERFLDQPGFAMELSKQAAVEMAKKSKESICKAIETLQNYSDEKVQEVIGLEQEIDHYEDMLGTYLVKLSSRNLSKSDSQMLSILLHSISDFERISDHAINVAESAQELRENGIRLTKKGQEELQVFSCALYDIIGKTVEVFRTADVEAAKQIEPLEEVIDALSKEMKKRHVNRLREGNCTLEAGIIFEDIITNLERVSDHCSNVAVCLIQISEDEYETHEYLDHVTAGSNVWFQKEYQRLKGVYALPVRERIG